MPDTTTAPRRDPPLLARRYQSTGKLFRRVLRVLRSNLTDPRQFYPPLTDRQARDIGLSPNNLELRRLRLPSQHTHHPGL